MADVGVSVGVALPPLGDLGDVGLGVTFPTSGAGGLFPAWSPPDPPGLFEDAKGGRNEKTMQAGITNSEMIPRSMICVRL